MEQPKPQNLIELELVKGSRSVLVLSRVSADVFASSLIKQRPIPTAFRKETSALGTKMPKSFSSVAVKSRPISEVTSTGTIFVNLRNFDTIKGVPLKF